MDFTESWNDTCSQVGYAARLGNLEYLCQFIRQKKPVDVADDRGWKPLHEAAVFSPSLACLEELLKHKCTNINWVTHEGETALLLVCKRRQGTEANDVVSLLLKYKADPNIVDNEEESPLLAAVRNENINVVEQLISAGADVNATDCSRWSPLHEAATKKNPVLVQALLRKGASIDIQDECGMTPIFTAAQHGCELCLEMLLTAAKERGQEDVVNVGAEDWATPLMIAAQQGFENCVKILLEHNANPDLKTSDHATALHMAVQGNHKLCLEILLEKMDLATMIKCFHPLTYINSDMICPLHLAVEWGSHESLKSLLAAGFSPDSLYDCVGLSIPNYIPFLPDHETALSYAVYKRDEISLAILLSAGASSNPPVKDALHPLLRAMSNPTMQEFHILMESGTNVNYRREGGSSNEVFLYCLLTSSVYLQPLLFHGCDPNMCFEDDGELFIKCAGRFLRKEKMPLAVFLKLILRFLIVTKAVQNAVFALNTWFPEDVKDILDEIDQPSSLKQICNIRLRQHLYKIHGVHFPNVISKLSLPSVLEEYVACRDI